MRPLGRTGGDVVEPGRDDVTGDPPFVPAVLARQRVAVELGKSAADRHAVRLGKPCITANQRLNAQGLGRIERRIPSGTALVAPLGVWHQHLAGRRMLSVQHGAKITRRDLVRESERFRPSTKPLSRNPALLSVVVVLGVFLLIVGLGLLGAQRPFRHDQHRSYARSLLPAGAPLVTATLAALSPGLWRLCSGIGVALCSVECAAISRRTKPGCRLTAARYGIVTRAW